MFRALWSAKTTHTHLKAIEHVQLAQDALAKVQVDDSTGCRVLEVLHALLTQKAEDAGGDNSLPDWDDWNEPDVTEPEGATYKKMRSEINEVQVLKTLRCKGSVVVDDAPLGVACITPPSYCSLPSGVRITIQH